MPSFGSFRMPSKRLVLSYILDWVVILAIAGVGGGFNSVEPYRRPFSLVDLSISFPHQHNDTVPWWIVFIVALIAPGIIIFLVAVLFVPGPRAVKSHPWSLIWRRKFWEWNTGWMGLGLSLATAFMLTEGFKNLFGKPRPDLLSRCVPDIDNLDRYVLGGYGQDVSATWVKVSADICTGAGFNPDELSDGFRSFPSGHASFSWAGLLYLSLFLCSKFAISIPFLPNRPYSLNPKDIALEDRDRDHLPLHNGDAVPIRNQAAAPPTYLLVLALVPVGAAAYISSTRYTDFRHHAIDILAGTLIGITTSWFSFRWYHLPIQQGAGWAWGARSRDRAFGIGVGVGNYVGMEGWGPASASRRSDLEVGHVANGNGVQRPAAHGPNESNETVGRKSESARV